MMINRATGVLMFHEMAQQNQQNPNKCSGKCSAQMIKKNQLFNFEVFNLANCL